MTQPKRILITDGSSLTSSRCILEAFKRGCQVTTTVRSPHRIEQCRRVLRNGGASQTQISNVKFVPHNELFTLEDCQDAVASCDFVIYAIPYHSYPIQFFEYADLVSIARDPVLNLLNAAKQANSKCRMVILNSFWAISGNKPSAGKHVGYTEADWSSVRPLNDMSQTGFTRRRNMTVIAERAIWEWAASDEGGQGAFHVAVIDPVTLIGPVLDAAQANSQQLIRILLTGEVKEGPDWPTGLVDMRDLADLAFRCLEDVSAAGERYIACADGKLVTIAETAKMVDRIVKKMDEGAKKGEVKYDAVPPWLIKALRWSGVLNVDITKELPKSNKVSNEKAKRLGWEPRGLEESLRDTVEAMREFGGLEKRKEIVVDDKGIVR